MNANKDFTIDISWNEEGLVPAIIQCHKTHKVLMCAWMNLESLCLSIEQQRTVFWSRSRRELWYKGETSKAVQLIKEIILDCDGDCILIKVEQQGTGACHTGKTSCFFRCYDENRGWIESES